MKDSRVTNVTLLIANKCQGLPLTIVVVAGLLSKSKRTKEEWKNVAENIKSFLMKDPAEQCLRVVALSYNYVPNDLKACLLYLGIFPEDSEISVKRLVRLWIAEGFLKLEGDLEEAAENRFQDHVDRCLVLVSQKSVDGRKIKTCRVNDLVNELCLREAQRENFLFIRNDDTETVPLVGCRLISIQKRRQTGVDFKDENFLRSLTHTNDDNSPSRRIRSIFQFAAPSLSTNPNFELGHLNLIRVLDLSSMYFSLFPLQILSLFVEVPIFFDSHIFWHTSRNSQIIESTNFHCSRISSLIYKVSRTNLGNKATETSETPKLLFAGYSKIQNIKKLCIRGHVYDYGMREEVMDFSEIVDLHQLETLSIKVDRYHVSHWSSRFHKSTVCVPNATYFPTKLKKLKLVETRLTWEDLNIIGQWPNLEVLKLKANICRGLEWRPIGGRFRLLKLLLIEGTNLKYWKATDDHFPTLDYLVIRHSLHLEEIPIEFADIYSLQLIELQNCSVKLVASAGRIQEEQESLGSRGVNIRSYNDPGLKTSDVTNPVMGFADNTSNDIVNDGLGPEASLNPFTPEIPFELYLIITDLFLKNTEKQISDYGEMRDLEARIKDFANFAEGKIEFWTTRSYDSRR
ncbi:hypothetical protein CQW23_33920 [Capsicum baccatum]|uniref:Disease resistance protein winged helix domain-containing protein n=1 Tax=Capsicum baccatum TaxID=33114 RepID=A0A2G2V0I4_CAPBA|nr:hypothetical protein CQW23_33920 [Capsicum baccatum]